MALGFEVLALQSASLTGGIAAETVTGTENHTNNISSGHQKGSKLPTGTTNAPQPIAA